MNKLLSNKLTKEQINHLDVLRKNVFEINKYPSFSLLIEGIERIIINEDFDNKSICLLERTQLYGTSLFGGLFNKADVKSFDCSPINAEKRGSYNSHMIQNKNFIEFKDIYFISQDENFKLPEEAFDIIFIPNLIHHFRDQKKLFQESYKSLKKEGKLIIFEPTFREIHQYPDDFIRYTPLGLETVLKENNFKIINTEEIGDSFEALTYILNVMTSKRDDKDFNKWCNQLIKDINKFKIGKIDIVKKHAKFPTAFITFAHK